MTAAPFKMLLTIHSAHNLPTGGLCRMYVGETALISSAQEDAAWTTHKSFHTKWQPLSSDAVVVWNQRYSVGVKRPSVEVLTVRIKDRTMETLVTTTIPLNQFTFDQNVVSVAPLFKHQQRVGELRFEIHIMYNNDSPPKQPEPPRPTRAASCPPQYRPPPPSYPIRQPVRPPPPQPVQQSSISPAVAIGAATGLSHLLSSVDPTGLSRMLPVAAAMLTSRTPQRSSSFPTSASHQNPHQNPLVNYFMMQGHSSNYDPQGTIITSILQQQRTRFNPATTTTSNLFQGLDGGDCYSSGNGNSGPDCGSGYDYTGGDCSGGGYWY